MVEIGGDGVVTAPTFLHAGKGWVITVDDDRLDVVVDLCLMPEERGRLMTTAPPPPILAGGGDSQPGTTTPLPARSPPLMGVSTYTFCCLIVRGLVRVIFWSLDGVGSTVDRKLPGRLENS